MRIADLMSVVILGANAWQDMKKKEILLQPTVLVIAAGVICKLLEGEKGVLEALLPGGILLLLAWGLRQKIGAGDALTVLAVGAWESARETWSVLLIGFFAAAVGAGIAFLFCKGKKEIPFVPFLFLGEIAMLLLREGVLQ